MEWLSQNWIWIAVGLGLLVMMRRGGCGMGHHHRHADHNPGHHDTSAHGGHGCGGPGKAKSDTAPERTDDHAHP